MIGTIRKHSSWLWWLIAGATIISFVGFMSSAPSRGNGNGRAGSWGTLYGHELTGEEVNKAANDFFITYFVNAGQWPDQNRNITPFEMDQRKYANLLFTLKAKSLGISVSESAVADAAMQMLASPSLTRLFGSSGQAVPMDRFVDTVLKSRNLTAADFEHAVRTEMTIEQLRMAMGMSGSLVTPQEAGDDYDREYREVSAQGVFLTASNYLGQVPVPAATILTEFYTNNMAYYRVPDRLQVNYVWFNVTNYIPAAKDYFAKTNFDTIVDSAYRQYGTVAPFKDAKTPEEAKTMLREVLIKQQAKHYEEEKAVAFRKALYDTANSQSSANPNPALLMDIAKQQGLTVMLSKPFADSDVPEEFVNAPSIPHAAFALTAEQPFSDLIQGDDGLYMIGTANQLPSYVPTYAEIGARVAQDYRMQLANELAIKATTNFFATVQVQTAVGRTFAQVAVAEGLTPVILTPFSLSSSEVPEVGDRVSMSDLKRAAFSTVPGHVAPPMRASDGAFVLYVQKMNPIDETKKKADLPGYIAQLRRGRENEAFGLWANNEAGREFRNIPALQKDMSAAAK